MKLSTLRRTHSKAPPGVTAVARVDRRTKSLAKRVRPGEIAVVDHLDMDRSSAGAPPQAGGVAVVNAAPSITGRYPNLGPRHLLDSGIILVDDVGEQVFAAVHDGVQIRLDAGNVYLGDQLVGSGQRQDRRSVEAAMLASRDGIP